MADLNYEESPGCCGVYQLHSFNRAYDGYDTYYIYASTWQEVIDQVNALLTGFVIQCWFVRTTVWSGELREGYDNADFRDLVRSMPNVRELGTVKNPNTGNEIDGYQWIAGQ